MAIKIDTTSILAASMKMNEYEVDAAEQEGRDTRPSNPNLWDQLW